MSDSEEEAVPGWVEGMGMFAWPVLITVIAVMFWAQAIVCEERFVPALNLICVLMEIPDSVAGATLMAGGASSPELFSSLISLFITHSSLGIGTVVGSEIFNHMAIVAGSVLASKTGSLMLDWKTVTRECSFYLLSLILLLYALHDTRYMDDDPEGVKHIYINWIDATVLIGGYLAYVAVCIYFEQICSIMCPTKSATNARNPTVTGASMSNTKGAEDALPLVSDKPKLMKNTSDGGHLLPANKRNRPSVVMHLEKEPSFNFHVPNEESQDEHGLPIHLTAPSKPGSIAEFAAISVPEHYKAHRKSESIRRKSMSLSGKFGGIDENLEMTEMGQGGSSGSTSLKGSIYQSLEAAEANQSGSRRGGSIRGGLKAMSQESIRGYSRRASIRKVMAQTVSLDNEDDIYEPVEHPKGDYFCVYLWQSSQFYTKARLSAHEWTLRYMIVDAKLGGLYSAASQVDMSAVNEGEVPPHVHHYLPTASSGGVFQVNVVDAHRGVFSMRCASHDYYFLTPEPAHLARIVDKIKALTVTAAGMKKAEDEEPEEEIESLIEWPHYEEVGAVGVAIHIFLLPLKFLLHFTIVDVRARTLEGGRATLSTANGSAVACVVWLAVLSYIMCTACEALGDLAKIPASVMGITVSAVGTSFPNLVASMVVANQGLGNMAVSNAFGSNSFNIMIGLGLPWLLYIGSNGWDDYHQLPATGIVVPVIILIVILIAFLAGLVLNNFVLYRYHGYTCLVVYVVFLGYALVCT